MISLNFPTVGGPSTQLVPARIARHHHPNPLNYHSQQLRLTTSDKEMAQLISIIESGFPQFRPSVPGTPVYSRWCHPLQGPHSHTTFPPTTHPDYPPFSTPRRDLYDCPCRNNCLLARHHPCHQSPAGELQLLQPHGALATQCSTLSTYSSSIRLLMRMC